MDCLFSVGHDFTEKRGKKGKFANILTFSKRGRGVRILFLLFISGLCSANFRPRFRAIPLGRVGKGKRGETKTNLSPPPPTVASKVLRSNLSCSPCSSFSPTPTPRPRNGAVWLQKFGKHHSPLLVGEEREEICTGYIWEAIFSKKSCVEEGEGGHLSSSIFSRAPSYKTDGRIHKMPNSLCIFRVFGGSRDFNWANFIPSAVSFYYFPDEK